MAESSFRTYNNQEWDMQITIRTADGSKEYQFPANYILELVIEENLFHWPIKGHFVYNNTYEMLEKLGFYSFRMDARDELEIKCFPKEKPTEGDIPEELWEMKIDVVVFDTEDPPSSSFLTKVKKLYFWDKRYQYMLDNNKEWSTATTDQNEYYLKNKNMSHMTDKERSLKTGKAIEALLIDNQFEEDIDEIDEGNSNVFYTSPAKSFIWDDLNYLLGIHSSSVGNDKCLFFTDRTKENKFVLKSIKDFYEKAEELQYEKMYLEDFGNDSTSNSKKAADKGVTIGQFSVVYTYQFVDTAGVNNNVALNNKPVYWYDTGEGQFGVDFQDHEIQNVKDEFKELYFSGDYANYARSPIFTLNKPKKEHYNIDPQFIFSDGSSDYFGTKESRYCFGRNQTLYSGIFLNETLYVRMIGAPIRTRGMFLGIDRLKKGSNSDNTLDYKLLGPWFLTKVLHIWKHDKYVNDIWCNKIGSYESLKIDDDAE